MNILVNGSTVCLTTHSNELLAAEAYNNGSENVTNVTVPFVIPSGIIVTSYVASQGTYDTGTNIWTVGTLTPSQNSSNPATLDLCFEVTDSQDSPYAITYGIDCDQCPDDNVSDNQDSRTIDGVDCNEFGDCIGYSLGCLNEYPSMSEAISELGSGKPFLAALDNLEGWPYRSLIVTPNIISATLTCPSDMVTNDCVNTCNGEAVLNGRAMNCSELLPTLTYDCGEDIVASEVSVTTYDAESDTTSFTITYTLNAFNCPSINNCCATSENGDFDIIATAVYTPDSEFATEGTVVITIPSGNCSAPATCSYHYVEQVC